MRQIREGVPTATRNHIDNVVDEVGLVEQHEPRGGRSFIFHQRTVERLYDLDRGPMVDAEIERLLAHVADDAEVRRFVAALLDINMEGLEPEKVIEAIRNRCFAVKDEEERMDLFDEVRRKSGPRTSVRIGGVDRSGGSYWWTTPAKNSSVTATSGDGDREGHNVLKVVGPDVAVAVEVASEDEVEVGGVGGIGEVLVGASPHRKHVPASGCSFRTTTRPYHGSSST